MKRMITEEDLATKQDKLIDGKSIKTINNESILGSGNITLPTVDSTVQVTGNQTINGVKTFNDALALLQGIQLTSGKKLVVETCELNTSKVELELGWMYFLITWSANNISFTIENGDTVKETVQTDTPMLVGFLNLFIKDGQLMGTASFKNAEGSPIIVNQVYEEGDKVYLHQGLGRPNTALRFRW